MSPEDLERIRGVYDAMNRRDLAVLRAYADDNPDFEWQSAADEPDPGVRRGSEWTKRNGRIASLREYPTVEEAREAAREASR